MIEQIEDTAKVKITKEKSQPRQQANRNSPDSIPKEQFMGNSIARDDTEAGFKVRTEFGSEDEKVLFGVPVAPCVPRWLTCSRLVMKPTEQPG